MTSWRESEAACEIHERIMGQHSRAIGGLGAEMLDAIDKYEPEQVTFTMRMELGRCWGEEGPVVVEVDRAMELSGGSVTANDSTLQKRHA